MIKNPPLAAAVSAAKGLLGRRGGGLTNERPRTDHVITGPMRGLRKNRVGRGQSQNIQTDFVTTRPTWPRGPSW